MILADFAKALGQFGDPRIQRVLWIGIALTFALLVGAYVALLWLDMEPHQVVLGLGQAADGWL